MTYSVRCSKCQTRMEWYPTGIRSGYWKCKKCGRTVGGVGHAEQHKEGKNV